MTHKLNVVVLSDWRTLAGCGKSPLPALSRHSGEGRSPVPPGRDLSRLRRDSSLRRGRDPPLPAWKSRAQERVHRSFFLRERLKVLPRDGSKHSPPAVKVLFPTDKCRDPPSRAGAKLMGREKNNPELSNSESPPGRAGGLRDALISSYIPRPVSPWQVRPGTRPGERRFATGRSEGPGISRRSARWEQKRSRSWENTGCRCCL